MTLVVRTPPASEPVSLAEAKAFLRVAHTGDDALITALIAAARETVEAQTGRALVSRAMREIRDHWDIDPSGAAVLLLGPVTAVEAVRVASGADGFATLAAASYVLSGADDPPRLSFKAGPPWPARAVGGIEIDYVAGYGTASEVPSGLRQACLGVVRWLFENGTDVALPATVLALIAPYRRGRL